MRLLYLNNQHKTEKAKHRATQYTLAITETQDTLQIPEAACVPPLKIDY